MTDKKRKSQTETMAEIDARLNGLLGALGDGLTEALQKLENAGNAEFHRAHDIPTPHGPIRAETGVRVRFVGSEMTLRAGPEPVNGGSEASVSQPEPKVTTPPSAQRAGQTAKSAAQPSPSRPDLVSYREDGSWILCADLPGVAEQEIEIEIDAKITPAVMMLRTTGRRRYETEQTLPPEADPTSMAVELRNGVLEVALKLAE